MGIGQLVAQTPLCGNSHPTTLLLDEQGRIVLAFIRTNELSPLARCTLRKWPQALVAEHHGFAITHEIRVRVIRRAFDFQVSVYGLSPIPWHW